METQLYYNYTWKASGGSVMVWGTFSWHDLGVLILLDSTIDSWLQGGVLRKGTTICTIFSLVNYLFPDAEQVALHCSILSFIFIYLPQWG